MQSLACVLDFPLASKTLAEIISFQIGDQQHWHWSDPTVKKIFYFEVDPLDAIDYERMEKKVEALPGITRAILYRENRLLVEGSCDLLIIREMGQITATELLSDGWILASPVKRDVMEDQERFRIIERT